MPQVTGNRCICTSLQTDFILLINVGMPELCSIHHIRRLEERCATTVMTPEDDWTDITNLNVVFFR